MKRILALLLCLLATAAPAATPQELQQAATARAAAARDDEARLTAAQAAALQRLRAAEALTDAAASRVAALAERRSLQVTRLAQRASEITPLLPVLLHLAHAPGGSLLAAMSGPEPISLPQAMRGASLLGTLAGQIEADAAAARGAQAELDALQAAIDAELPRVAVAQVEQARAAALLDQQLATTRQTRRAAEHEAEAAARQAAADAAQAETLRAAVAKLEQARTLRAKREAALPHPAPASEKPGALGHLTPPVAGNLVRHFGDATDAGTATGVAYQVAPAARVVAPCGGRVVFSGPFRSFGKLLILDCGRGYHIVLAGFDRLDAQIGQSIAAGAPVGIMPGWDPRGGTPRPTLYVELRRGGEAINPLPFLS